jgi:site-specific DNA-methyltransferase (adenine-specific)/adenine-specific DNA-methyltransferase
VPTLNWIGKDAVVKHHKDVPFRLLEPVPELSCGAADSGNLIVQGDNLHALKALLPRYAGQVKCIYIDPPYNTGNEGWVYNDNVNSPEIRKWLGEVVGKEGETLDRHDRWLCMMYPRLVLLKQFLREDGAIFVSIDDSEQAHLKLLMDEVFGSQNFVGNLIWEKADSPRNSARQFSTDHDFIVVYSKSPEWVPYKLERTEESNKIYQNPDKDLRGPWIPGDPYANKPYSKGLYEVEGPTGRKFSPPKGRYWRISEEKLKELDEEGRIWWGPTGNARPSIKRYLSEVGNLVPRTFWSKNDVGSNRTSKNEMREVFPESSSFDTPKPTRLIQRILQIAASKDSLILDSFAGSGTTGHAVLKQNAEDGGKRRFIMVEMDEGIARNVTAERVKRVVPGYTTAKGKEVPALSGGFQFCKLSDEPLFTADGPIRADVSFAQLAEFVWFMETGSGLPPKEKPASEQTPYLGQYKDRAVFLLYNGILKDKSDSGGNVLNSRTLEILNEALPNFDGPRNVYGARTRFDKTKLAKLGITFHQLPYDLAVKTWF